jgi:hypothetical protein
MSLSVETDDSETRRDRTYALLLATLAVALFIFSHARGFSSAAFSDDIGVIRVLAQHANVGTIGAEVWSRVIGPLAPGGTMWRPLPYASFALDAALFADNVALWRMTNVLFHALAALSVGILLRSLRLSLPSAAFGFALFLLQPWSPEVTIWIVGRYDAFATFFIVATLICVVRCTGLDRWMIASLVFATLAYASKESATTLVAHVAVVAWLRDQRIESIGIFRLSRSSLWSIAGHGLLLTCYLVWRFVLYKIISVDLYGASSPTFNVFAYLRTLVSHVAMPFTLVQTHQVAAVIAIASVLSALAISFLYPSNRPILIAGFFMLLAVAAALAFVVPTPDGSRDGWRVYHLYTVGLTIACATIIEQRTRARMTLAICAMASLAIWQRSAVEEWRVASNAMYRLQSEITTLGRSMHPNDYALLVLPDAIGRVPFARNAQGALMLVHSGDRERLTQMVAATDDTLKEWRAHIHEQVLNKILLNPPRSGAPTTFYCFNGYKLMPVGFWVSATNAGWREKWIDVLAHTCPNIAYR